MQPSPEPPVRRRGPRSDALRNQRDLLQAATTSFHRDGLQVPMSTIAAEAGVGVGTLYRHFATREALLAALTHRSFERVLDNARAAETAGVPIECLRRFVEAAITQRTELVLPLHGGPPLTAPATAALRTEVHSIVARILARGVADASIRADVSPRDVVIFGAMLSQPRPVTPDWDALCRRMLDTYLRGLRP